MDDIEAMSNMLKQLKEQMDTFQESIAPMEAQASALKAKEGQLYQEYIAQVAVLRQDREKIDQSMFEARTKMNQASAQINQISHKIEEERKRRELEAKREEQQLEFAALEKRWDQLTIGAPWREFAFDHQIKAAHYLTSNRKVILADPMGLGKTLSAIASCDMIEAATKEASEEFPFLGEEKEVFVPGKFVTHDNGEKEWVAGHYTTKIVDAVERPAGRKILYFCPASMLRNVEREFRNWAKHRNVTLMGGMTKTERAFIFDFVLKGQPQYVVVCNYEAWRKDLSLIDTLIAQDFDTIIIDEAHNIKDTKSIAYRGIKRLIDELKPPYVIPMTGTPILNRPQELFSLLTLVNPLEFANLNDFLYNYCEQTDDGYWKFQPGGLDRIAKRIGKNFLRRTRDMAGIKLPEKTITEHLLEVDTETYPNQAKARDQMRKHAMIMIDEAQGKAIAATAVIAMFTRLRQIETWPAGIEIKDPITKNVKLKLDVEESQKIDYLIKWNDETKEWDGLIPEVIEDERCVLFSQFKAPLRELHDRISRMGKRAVILDGETSTALKDEIMVDFDNKFTSDRNKAKYDIVLCNYRVGGVGMNLTAATQMFILDEEWNPGKRDQAYDRIHRIGQDKPVTIHVLRDKNTIDDWLAGLIEHKESVVEGFNSTMVNPQDFKEALDSGLL